MRRRPRARPSADVLAYRYTRPPKGIGQDKRAPPPAPTLSEGWCVPQLLSCCPDVSGAAGACGSPSVGGVTCSAGPMQLWISAEQFCSIQSCALHPLRCPQSSKASCCPRASSVPCGVHRCRHSGSLHWLSHCSTISLHDSVPPPSGSGPVTASFALLMQPSPMASASASAMRVIAAW